MTVSVRGGAPPQKRSGPQDTTPGSRSNTQVAAKATHSTATVTQANLVQAEALVRAITDQAAAEEAAYQRGLRDAAQMYRAMFDHGVDVGRRQEANEAAEDWRILAAKVRSWAKHPRYRELEERRYPGRTHEELLKLRGRDRFPLPDRQCRECGQRVPGGLV